MHVKKGKLYDGPVANCISISLCTLSHCQSPDHITAYARNPTSVPASTGPSLRKRIRRLGSRLMRTR